MSSTPSPWRWDDRHKDHYRVSKAEDGSVSFIWAGNPPPAPQPSAPPPQPVEPYGARSSVPRTPFVPVSGGQVGQQSSLHASVSRSNTAPRGTSSQPGSYHSNYMYAAPQQASKLYSDRRAPLPQQPGGPLPGQPQPRDPYGAQANPSGGMYGRSPYDAGTPLQANAYPGSAHLGAGQPNQGVGRSPSATNSNTNYTYNGQNWMSSNPVHPTRSSSISVQPSSTNRSSGRSAVYHGFQNYPSQGQNPPASARAAGKQPSQEVSTLTRSTTFDPSTLQHRKEDDLDDDLELTRAFSASRISHAYESKAGSSSRGLDGRGTTATPQSLPVAKPPESGAKAGGAKAGGAKAGGASSALDPKVFKHHRFHTEKFFTLGRVFLMLHIENAGETRRSGANHTVNSHYFTTVAHDEVAHHQFRRFVVVETRNSQHFCYCCPITTYNGRATTKSKVDQRAHSIVYMGKTPPQKLEGEKHMRKEPLRIVPTDKDDRLDPKSRIDFGRAYLIEHNVKVKDIGKIHEDSMPKLLDYRKLEKDRS